MTDIVKRLRKWGSSHLDETTLTGDVMLYLEAADEIERLRAALEPFAQFGDVFAKQSRTDDSPWATTPDQTELQLGATRQNGWTIKVGDLRRARAALKGDGNP